MKREMLLIVCDRSGQEWCFEVFEDPVNLEVWRDAGLNVFEVVATVPAWAVELGLARPWAALQAAWQWLRIF